MEKEFIPYEQSLALKELGFDEPCFWCYLENDISAPADFSRKGRVYPSNSDLILDWVSAPLYQQAFRWFREKYGFLGVPNWYSGGFYCYTIKDVTDKVSPELFTEFLTYEEAELECLKKLIEIVKRKVV